MLSELELKDLRDSAIRDTIHNIPPKAIKKVSS